MNADMNSENRDDMCNVQCVMRIAHCTSRSVAFLKHGSLSVKFHIAYGSTPCYRFESMSEARHRLTSKSSPNSRTRYYILRKYPDEPSVRFMAFQAQSSTEI